ncbi:MAG: SDR family oxidoreductase [Anaerolineae bacterium]|nr:SDR family oxidoreductase [Anaerolineales bacterium]MCQ3976801.1 short-chain dehydrogenase [Anaerolineae bacterium]
MDFTGKVAVITGAASGMGAATAREFNAAGGEVVIVDRNGELAAQVAAEIKAGPPLVGNVGDSAFCQKAVKTTLDRHGRLDVLVNAAGIIVRADALNTSDEQWQRVLNVNVSGVFYMSRAAVTVMKQQGQGAIVNFGSIWGEVGATGVVAYCASKGAVHQITRAMALDHVKDGIRINAVCPGEVNTPMLQSERSEPVTPELLQRLAETVPMGRLAEPVEIARVVLFLASDAASYMTGAMVNVDAGFTAR